MFEHKERIDHVLSWWPELSSREQTADERQKDVLLRFNELEVRAGRTESHATEIVAAQAELKAEMLARCATDVGTLERKMGSYIHQACRSHAQK